MEPTEDSDRGSGYSPQSRPRLPAPALRYDEDNTEDGGRGGHAAIAVIGDCWLGDEGG